MATTELCYKKNNNNNSVIKIYNKGLGIIIDCEILYIVFMCIAKSMVILCL